MSVPCPKVQRPDDMGDVLAEIRRLVAHGGPVPQPDARAMVVRARVVAGEDGQPNTSQSLALSVELPMSGAAQPETAIGAGASANVNGTANALSSTGEQSSTASGSAPVPEATPLRLNRNAMLAAADPTERLRLPPSLSVMEGTRHWRGEKDPPSSSGKVQGAGAQASDPPIPSRPAPRQEEEQAHTEKDAAATGMRTMPDAPAPPPIAGTIRSMDTDPPASGSPDTTPFNREPDMQAYANTPASPLPLAMPLMPERPAAEAANGLQDEEENPLRALLREVVREEFEGELKRSLDDNLRRLVRTEIAAALTEALMRRPKG